MLDRRLEDKELLIIAHRVLEGLVAVHSHGIVHRDLSPDNIILRDGSAERATIIDFGIAKDTATGARTIVGNEFAGKYEYAAPEQLEGRAEYRTDLYSLGASLLAAHRRDVPFLGATPGEIIRRKQDALDTSGVSSPLKEVIELLSAPALENRPKDAQAALDQVSAYLKPQARTVKGKPAVTDDGRASRGFRWLALPVLALLGGLALWFGFPREEALPIAAPYKLAASLDEAGQGAFETHAPSLEAGDILRASFEDATGVPTAPDAISLAQGAPSEQWPGKIAQLMALAGRLETWSLSVTDKSVVLDGLALDIATRAQSEIAMKTWSSENGFEMQAALAAGPKELPLSTTVETLSPLETCGTLQVTGASSDTSFALFDTITIRGDLANASDPDTIRTALLPKIGDRKVKLETTILNTDLCAIRAVLPEAETANLSIWLGNGETGAPSLTGAFTTGQNPVIEVHLPAGQTEGSLWVMVVDNTGKVFHVLPNINLTEHQVATLGEIKGGVRQIRVLHSIEEFKQDNTKLAFQVNEGDYGKSEVVAILSKTNLFDLRRPRDESVASVAEALQDVLKGRDGEIIAVASRIIDARP
jgi:serine/threonine protein kinase